ncbi:G1/S-specific cyclin cln3 [Halocaridina rubra]|uniref:Battenin n=1 Tax=Halocaridina rubra TaxID=373956 RepID=A0AAN9A415_HALRR
MSLDLCKKSLLEHESNISQEKKNQVLKVVPSPKYNGTVQEEAYLLKKNNNFEINPKSAESLDKPKRDVKEKSREKEEYYNVNERDGTRLDNVEGEGGGGGREETNKKKKADNSNISDGECLSERENYFHRYRDLAAYWCLGFCNNFTYWVMITAAYDLLTPEFQGYHERSEVIVPESLIQTTSKTSLPENHFEEILLNNLQNTTFSSLDTSWQNHSVEQQDFVNTFECQKHSTGVILIADTLPATVLTLSSPVTLLLPVSTRVWLVSLLCAASYLTLGLAHPKWVFLGVALASASRGFSDSTFLGHASHYHKHVLSMWSSGTGVATFIGPLLYSTLTTGGLDPRHVLLVFLVIPLVTAMSFWCLLSRYRAEGMRDTENPEEVSSFKSSQDVSSNKQKLSMVIWEKICLFLRAQKYILPLSSFYLIMYTTNQGLLELVYFPSSMFTHSQQYSWSNTVRCLGTLLSRSAHKFMLLPNAWLYCCLALMIMGIIGTEAHFHYLPSEYIIFILLLLQGLTEGAAFRSSVFCIHNKTSERDRAFCLGVFPTALFLPALVAGLISMPLHEVLCLNHKYKV